MFPWYRAKNLRKISTKSFSEDSSLAPLRIPEEVPPGIPPRVFFLDSSRIFFLRNRLRIYCWIYFQISPKGFFWHPFNNVFEIPLGNFVRFHLNVTWNLRIFFCNYCAFIPHSGYISDESKRIRFWLQQTRNNYSESTHNIPILSFFLGSCRSIIWNCFHAFIFGFCHELDSFLNRLCDFSRVSHCDFSKRSFWELHRVFLGILQEFLLDIFGRKRNLSIYFWESSGSSFL